ncbi:MAG: hypothetical protein ACF8NJ_03005 [Phycisphaerales bacterium JB038]
MACDVRDAYREPIAEGREGPAVTDHLIEAFAESVDATDEWTVFWLALAATQWKLGRLEDRVREAALDAIDSGRDLERWQEAGKAQQRKRRLALEKLREQLHSPQPEPKKLRRPWKDECEWEVGEVIGYRLLSELWALLWLIDVEEGRSGRFPLVTVLQWRGQELPSPQQICELPPYIDGRLRRVAQQVRPRTSQGCETRPRAYLLCRLRRKDRPDDRLKRTGVVRLPAPEWSSKSVLTWAGLDGLLRLDLGVE